MSGELPEIYREPPEIYRELKFTAFKHRTGHPERDEPAFAVGNWCAQLVGCNYVSRKEDKNAITFDEKAKRLFVLWW